MECVFCNAVVSSIVWDAFIPQPEGLRGCQWSSASAGEGVVLLCRRDSGTPGPAAELPGPDSACVCLHLSAELHLLLPRNFVFSFKETQNCSTQQLAALGTEIPSTGFLSKNWTCTKLSTALAHYVTGCCALPSQIEPLKHLEGKWNKIALDGELSYTNSASRAQE